MSQRVSDQEEYEFTVDGRTEKLSREDVERRLKWDAVNTQRATEIKQEREAVAREREAVSAREATLAQERTQLYSTLDTLVNKVGTETSPAAQKVPRVSVHDTVRPHLEALASLDFVSDADASRKLQQSISGLTEGLNKAYEDRDTARQQEMEVKLADAERRLRGVMDGRVAEVQQQAEVKLTRHTAAGEAQDYNDKVLRDTVASQLGGLRLSDDEVSAIKKKAETTYADNSGSWDANAGKWLISERGVLEAARTIDSVFDKMQAARSGAARADGLRARVNGEDASRSTPLRSRPAFGGEADNSGAAEKFALLEAKLQARTISPQDAMAVLSEKEITLFKQWRGEQQAALRS